MAKTRPGKRDLDSYTIKGTNKVVKVGDCVLMRPSDSDKPPYVARVEKIEADNRNNVKVRVRWYYRPEESIGGRRQFHGAKELFLSDHYDVQSAHTIEGKCIVHTFKNYTKLENVGAEDYFCRFEYKAATGGFTPDRVAVYCKCEMPYNPDDLMVQCEDCKDWFHPSCMGTSIEEAKKLENFVCSDCSSDDDAKKAAKSFPVSPSIKPKALSSKQIAKMYGIYYSFAEMDLGPISSKYIVVSRVIGLRCHTDVVVVVLLVSVFVSFVRAEEPEIYLVLVDGHPLAFHPQKFSPNSEAWLVHAKQLEESHNILLKSTLEVGSYSKLYSFKHIANGFALHTTPSQAKKLVSTPGVKLVEKDKGVKLMTTYTPEFLGLPTGAWAQEGGDRNAGEGIVIGMVDTGIDPKHPSFAYDLSNPFPSPSLFSGACDTGPRFPSRSCNGKIISARYFSAGAQAAAQLNASIDFLSPFDAVGHGSHVASTAAGNHGVPVIVNGFFYGQASGMAPRAQIAVYKAIFPSIGTMTDVVAAIEQAVADGVDILTLSVGPDEPPKDTISFLNVFEIFMLQARRAGVFVVQAVGNKGPSPSTVVSFSPWAVGVAAANMDRSFSSTLILGNGQKIEGAGPTMLQFKLVLAKDALKPNGSFPKTPEYIEECQHPEVLNPDQVRGSIVICTFSAWFYNATSTIAAIIDTSKILGFAGFVFIANPAYGDFIAQPIPFSLPSIMIPRVADAQILFRGPDIIDDKGTPTDVLKPDILAPGHLVWAAWSPMSVSDPIFRGYNFALLSGTSMATPHVSGIAALIKQCNPSWSPSMISSAISTTASTYDNFGETIMAEGYYIDNLSLSTPFGHGAGLINPTRALDPGLVFSSEYEDYISFLCSLPNVNPETIRTSTGTPCNISLPLAYPTDLNLPSITISSLNGSRLVHRTAKNVASKPETYLFSVFNPRGVEVSMSPSCFTIAPQGSQDLLIKFNATQPIEDFSFGEIVLTGSLDHIVRIPLSVLPVSRS
ncbi:hypothetical protein Syun_009897 [Stephania yunnanensis]|uniref:Uncharacterized protein n=2 Tax=Magnoliopsida TaxID=3398 RepID=A0AAP0KFD9_9MAGN